MTSRTDSQARQEAREQQQQAAAGDLTQIQEIQAKLASAREEIAALVQRREQAKAQVAAAQQELTALAKRLGDRRAKVSEADRVRVADRASKPTPAHPATKSKT
jgi:chromosome segregation ATPase